MASRAKVSRKPAKKKVQKVPSRRVGKGKSFLSRFDFLERVPVSEAFLERAMTVSMIGLIGAAVLGFAWMSGLPGFVGTEMAKVVGRAGFEVKRVEIVGVDRMDRLTVYNVALDQHSRAMPLVDLDKVRDQLMQFSWIEDARVSRRLPDTLVVDIVERKPAAIWQNNQKLSLIDAKGVVLERVDPNATPNLPLLIGHNANQEAVALNDLIKKVPSLKPSLQAATWVGNRRWDLQFRSGEVLALPEGEDAATAALTRFAKIDGVERLLGRGFARFDMRDPTKMVVRKSGAPRPESKPDENKGETADSAKGAQG
jgi:cell division protein FtsQ